MDEKHVLKALWAKKENEKMAGIVQINNIGWWMKQQFGTKVVKLALDGGFSCPNRDGTCGTGGCIFCSSEGSGELASAISKTDAVACDDYGITNVTHSAVSSAIREQIELRKEKWPGADHFIAYFQNHTNTYAPADELREKFSEALSQPGIMGLAIATRPDCLPDDVLDLLSELNEKTFLWVELGLQTIHGDNINRGYPLPVYDEAVRKLTERNIRIVTHLILGLPGETKQDMEESVRYVCRPTGNTKAKGSASGSVENAARNQDTRHIFGLKLHLLNVVKGAPMEKLYPGYTPFGSPEEYIGLVCDLLEIIPPDITIHRLTGDVPRKLLIAPEWSYKKRTILNGIARELRIRGSHQGCRISD